MLSAVILNPPVCDLWKLPQFPAPLMTHPSAIAAGVGWASSTGSRHYKSEAWKPSSHTIV